jgi:cysteine desulfurase
MIAARTYLDYNASAPLRPEAREAMLRALDVTGNPSSVHWEGRRARALVDTAREEIARLVNAKPAEVIFTSGATEANAWVMSAGWVAIAASLFEHDSVLAPARAAHARLISLAVSETGLVEEDELVRGLDEVAATGRRALLTLQLANNETGVLQPVPHAAALARERGLLTHTDAVQALGRVAVDMRALGADFMSLSSHKIGGPTGAGALIVREGSELRPLIVGGGQERRRRAGTESVAAIAGFGAAAAAAARDLPGMSRIRALRDALENEVLSLTPKARVIGAGADRLVNTSCIALPGAKAETLVIKLDLAGIAVSAGAACSSGKVGASHVLSAMGLAPEVAASAIRVSLGHATREDDIGRFLAAWKEIAAGARLAA